MKKTVKIVGTCSKWIDGEDLPEEKQIEEMAQEIFNTCAWRFGRPNDYKEIFNDIAEDLIKLNYRKIPEGSVVLTKGAYESLSSKAKSNVVNAVKIRKETAREILDEVSKHYGGAWLVELYKQFSVEVEE